MRYLTLYLLVLLACNKPQPLRLSTASGYDNLYTALTNARSGDTIRITGTVDCSGRKPLEIRVSNISVIGGTLRSNTVFPTVTGALLVNYGSNNRFIGTTFQGSDLWANQYDEIWTWTHYFTGFLNYGDSTLLKSCKFVNCGRNGAWFYKLSGCEVDGCSFTGIMWQGTGYGIWAGSIDGGSIRIHHCTFNRNRVHIDGSGHLTNIAIDSCTFGKQTTFVPVQRHDRSTTRGIGGGMWRLSGSTFLDSIEPCRPTVPVSDTAYIIGNKWRWSNCTDAVSSGSYFCSKPSDRVVFSRNASFGLVPDLVTPPPSGVFIMSIKSSYWQGLSPYTITVHINDTIVYRSNVAGKLSWKKLAVKVGPVRTFSITVQCDSTVNDTTRSEVQVWLDDVGVQSSFSSFEGVKLPVTWKQTVTGVWSTGIRSCDASSGSRCFMIRQPFRSRPVKGWSVKLIAIL